MKTCSPGRDRRWQGRIRSACRVRRLRLRPRRPRSDSPFSGRSEWKISPLTIDVPSATMPANSAQPAMVLKRSFIQISARPSQRMSWSAMPFTKGVGPSSSAGQAARRSIWPAQAPGPRLPVERRKPSFIDAVERLPPAFAVGIARADQSSSSAKCVKTWRRPSEGARHGCGSSVHSGPGSAAIPPSSPRSGRRTSQTAPSRSIQWAMPWRSGRSAFALRGGKRFRGRRWPKPRNRRAGGMIGATGCARAADRRAKVHHGLREIAGAVWRGHRRDEAARFSACLAIGMFDGMKPGRSLARHWCRPTAALVQRRSQRSPRRCSRQSRQSAQLALGRRKAAAAPRPASRRR